MINKDYVRGSENLNDKSTKDSVFISKMLIDLLHRINDKFNKKTIMRIVHKLQKQYDEVFFTNFINVYSTILFENNECNMINMNNDINELKNEAKDKNTNEPANTNLFRIDDDDKALDISFNKVDKRYGIDSFISTCYEEINGLDGPDLFNKYLMFCEKNDIKERPTSKRTFIKYIKRFTGEPVQKWVKIKNSDEDEDEKSTVKRLYYLKPNVFAFFKYQSSIEEDDDEEHE